MPELQFSSVAEFIDMGGYALYVWSAYAVFAVLMAFTLIQPRLARRNILKQQRARLQREEKHNVGAS